MRISALITLIFFCLLYFPARAQEGRERINLNTDWSFVKGQDSEKVNIALPHTWNAEDILDDEPGYYRGTSLYKKKFRIPEVYRDKLCWIFFEGVNQDAKIFVNGKPAGEHYGGYTAFRLNITELVLPDTLNTIRVEVSNALNPAVPPVGGDLCHFGGIYRDVWLEFTENIHFDMEYFGSDGIFYTPVYHKDGSALKTILRICGSAPGEKDAEISVSLKDDRGSVISEESRDITITGGVQVTEIKMESLKNISAWSPESPELYTAEAIIREKSTRREIDRLAVKIGFRSLDFTADEGFILNAEKYPIHGVGKHQDYAGMGYAVPDYLQVKDIEMVKDMGANLIRPHYPLDPVVYKTCDEKGIMIWNRLPIMDKINTSPEFLDNSILMMKEILYQAYNHPSVIVMDYACEVFGDLDWYREKPVPESVVKKEVKETYRIMKALDDTARILDPTRYTAMSYHTDPTPGYYFESGLVKIPMINSWNIYQGWYHNNLDNAGPAIDTFRAYNPDRPYVLAEFGAGSDPRIFTEDPTIFDNSIEYQLLFHKKYLEETAKREWISGIIPWTFVDFQVDERKDAVPHINSKGLLTSDRQFKDAFFLFKAHWNPEPMVHICGMNSVERMVFSETDTYRTDIEILSNCKRIELFHNGKSVGVADVKNHSAVFGVSFTRGQNLLEAKASGETVTDSLNISFSILDPVLGKNNIDRLCVNAGQSRTSFYDPGSGDIWIPDREYYKGGYGRIDGKIKTLWPGMKAWEGIREGISDNITKTDLDPVYQTFLYDIHSYRLDIPDGNYRIKLLFAEPFDSEERKNYGGDNDGNRVFNVRINGIMLIENLDLAGDYGVRQAVEFEYFLGIKNKHGLDIRLEPVKGSPVLSGIRIEKTGS